jgi:hypothetical protein
MMRDDFRSDDGRDFDGRDRGRSSNGERPLIDREIPLDGPTQNRLSAAMHAWLDGDISEAEVRRDEAARVVDFWVRLQHAAADRRGVTAPADLPARIMSALGAATAPDAVS